MKGKMIKEENIRGRKSKGTEKDKNRNRRREAGGKEKK